eukprot:gene17199-biopygen10139
MNAAPPDAEPVFIAQGLTKVYGEGATAVHALRGVDLTIVRGEFVVLLGASGSGKSTLLNALAGFAPPSSGRIVVDGKPVEAPGPERGMVFQEYALFPWMTVADNVAFGLQIKGLPKAEIAATVARLLKMLSLGDFGNRFPKDLSGG